MGQCKFREKRKAFWYMVPYLNRYMLSVKRRYLFSKYEKSKTKKRILKFDS